ncbi:unnamed protein product [Allacma fusca]|uniref:Uncharacterized protein n=1 Tax=Allacma fusca TaxID=39272 RepID=A0A8J2LUC4_9HEXA|nr:unnamed protein product [Allacma fusca]
MMRILITLAVFSACVFATPLERAGQQQMVVDVPAGAFELEDSDEAVQVPLTAGSSEEMIPVVPVDKEAETIVREDPKVPARDPDDWFNFPLPQLFFYRRPVITDPFSSFSGFQPQRQPQPYQPQQNQFNAFSNHMEAMMKRMQEQMSSLWGALLNPNYALRPTTFNLNRPVIPSIPDSDEKTSVIDFDSLPDNYSNSTSETKVIDGQLVQVNKTIHKIASNDSSGFFSFQVIKIHPQASANDAVNASSVPTEITHEDTGSAPTEVKDEKVQTSKAPEIIATSEKSEDPSLNEIDEPNQQQQTERLDEVEKFPFLLNRFKEQYSVDGTDGKSKSGDKLSEKLVKYEEFDIVPHDHPLQNLERTEVVDLSDDIRVNKILEEQNRKAQLKMINPDVELLIL